MGYVFEPRAAPIRMTVDYLHRTRDDLSGEIVVESLVPGVPSHLHQARVHLSSTGMRRALALYLEGLTNGTVVNWPGLLEQFCSGVMRRERQGEPFEQAGGREAKNLPPEPPDLVEHLIPAQAITLLYGLGGTGKGWLATFAAVCLATGTPLAGFGTNRATVLYLDWEDHKEILDRRIVRVRDGLGLAEPPTLHYR